MQNTIACQVGPSLTPSIFSHLPDAPRRDAPRAPAACADHQFIALLDAYRASGGLAPAQEVVALFRRHSDEGAATVTKLIVDNRVICFGWQATMWLPLFQFNPRDMSQHPALRGILTELSPKFEPWQVANWFAQPNTWLQGRTPVDVLDIDPQAVLSASRCVLPGPDARPALLISTHDAQAVCHG